MQSQRQSNSSSVDKNNISLFATIAKSFSTPDSKNKLLFFSKAVPLVEPIAHYLVQISTDQHSAGHLILLLDFEQEQTEWMNHIIMKEVVANPLPNRFDQAMRKNTKIIKLNTQTIQKRRGFYLKNGLYSLSCQIFLTDLLRGQATVNLKHISKIIIKLREKVKNYYHYYGWLTTMVRIWEQKQKELSKAKVPMVFVCNQAHYYCYQDDLKEIYRVFFCGKVVIWPFGRSEIHQKLTEYRQKKNIKEWQHSLSHSQGQQQISTLLSQLYTFLKKTHGLKYGQKSKQLDDFFYTKFTEQSFMATHGQLSQFQTIKTLLTQLQNVNKIVMLNTIATFIEENSGQLWNSNNEQVVGLIEKLVERLKEGVFVYEKDERKVDVKKLVEGKGGLLGSEGDKYRCLYEVGLKLSIRQDDNEKINELIKIVQDSKLRKTQHPSQSQLIHQSILDELLKRSPISQPPTRTLLVMCNSKSTQRYISTSLMNHLMSNSYMDYLMTIHRWLKFESSKRQTILRRIFEKRKVGKDEEGGIKESKLTPMQKKTESKIILEELLFSEIEVTLQILLDYELQQSIINEQFKAANSEGKIYDINQEQIKLNEKIQDRLKDCKFQIIDIDKINKGLRVKSGSNIIVEGKGTRLRVVVEHFNRGADLANFYSLLTHNNPQTVLFYSPNTHLLRGLYLFYSQGQPANIRNLHILSYQDSYEHKVVQQEVIKQDKAFWQISQKRSKLSQYHESPNLRIKPLNMRDNFDRALNSYNNKTLLKGQDENGKFNLGTIDFGTYRRVVIVDTREFKSYLPSYLYHHGFEVVPMFLKSADYILSDDTAVQKKSVNTRDLHQSLRSDRLNQQLKRMNGSFRHSYLLIEFEQDKDVSKGNFSGYQYSKGGSQARELRKRLFQLLHRYDKVRLIWSTSVSQSCRYFQQLKNNKAEPDLLKFQKAQAEDLSYQKPQPPLPAVSEVSASKQLEQ